MYRLYADEEKMELGACRFLLGLGFRRLVSGVITGFLLLCQIYALSPALYASAVHR